MSKKIDGKSTFHTEKFTREIVGVNCSYVGEADKFGFSFELINHLAGKEFDWSIDDQGKNLTQNLPSIGKRSAGVDRKPGESVKISQLGFYKVNWEYIYRGSDGGHEHKHLTEPYYNNNFPERVSLRSGESFQIDIGPAAGVVIERVAVFRSPSDGYVNYFEGRVLIPGLVDIGHGYGFERIGYTASHPSGQYVTPEVKTALWAIAREYCDAVRKPLIFNDASLIWGGVFDLDKTFLPPHSEHRSGTSIDIAATKLTMTNETKFLEILSKYTSNYILEGENNRRHYHVRF